MVPATSRFSRERKTIKAMIGLYCRDHHARRRKLCEGCGEVLAYAELRLDKCLFPDNKPTCANCPVHCYKPAMREQVKQIMRYAGPRMIYHHPYLAIRHMIDGRGKKPPIRRKPGRPSAGGGAAGTAPEGAAAPEGSGSCCAAASDNPSVASGPDTGR